MLRARDIIDEESPGRPTIVGPRDALEGLLACSVPYLQLYVLIVNLNCAGPELNSNSQVVLLAEPFVRKLEEQA